MYCSVVINNYNYGNYLAEAVDSVLEQTYQAFELWIVDDGSTDNSLEILARYEALENVRVIRKPNGGQLSAFNAVADKIRGELVFFLDADDFYAADYLERAVAFYRDHPDSDFLAVGRKAVGECKSDLAMAFKKSSGYSVLRVHFLYRWLGNSTSAISMKRSVLEKVLPLPFESDWRLRADECLVIGASLVGAKKYRLNRKLIHYRIHGENGYHGREISNDEQYRLRLGALRMMRYIEERNGIVIHLKLLLPEFRSIPEKDFEDLKDYLNVLLLLRPSPLYLVKYAWLLVREYLRSTIARRLAGRSGRADFSI